jgi:hypothetical protein
MPTTLPPNVEPLAADEQVARDLSDADRLYDRYITLAGISRIPTDLEAAAWERQWAAAEREPRPVGLVFDAPAHG